MVQNISAQRHQCTYPAVSSSLLTDTQYYKETRECLPYFYCLMFSAHGLQNDCPLPCSVTQMCLLGSFKLFALFFHFFFFFYWNLVPSRQIWKTRSSPPSFQQCTYCCLQPHSMPGGPAQARASFPGGKCVPPGFSLVFLAFLP